MLYRLVQVSPCVLLAFIAMGIRVARQKPNDLETFLRSVVPAGASVVACVGFAGLLAFLAPKRYRGYVTGLLFCIFMILILLSGAL